MPVRLSDHDAGFPPPQCPQCKAPVEAPEKPLCGEATKRCACGLSLDFHYGYKPSGEVYGWIVGPTPRTYMEWVERQGGYEAGEGAAWDAGYEAGRNSRHQ